MVDLRFAIEVAEDPIEELPVDVVHVSLLGEWDDDYRDELEARMRVDTPADYLRWSYLDFLERFRQHIVVIVAIAGAPAGAVCVHCVGT